MLELFRRNLFINSILLFPYILIIRISLFLAPSNVVFDTSNSLVFHSFESFNIGPLSQWLLTSLLVFIQASMINRLSIKNSYDRNLSLFPGLIYALLVSVFPEFLALSPALIANTFVILALFSLNKLYKKANPSKYIFNAGLWGGIAFFIYCPTLVLLPVLIIGLFSLRAQNLKELFQLIIAFGFSYYFFGGVCYLMSTDYSIFEYLSFSNKNLSLGDFRSYLIASSIIVSAIILVIFRRPILLKKSVQGTKKIIFFYWMLLFSSLILFVGVNDLPYYKLLLVFLPIGVLSGLSLVNIKSKLIAELVHIALLLLLFNIHFDWISYLN